MLALTKKTDYALIALSHLAGRPGEVISAREIASDSGVPLAILTNILKTLTGAGMVLSTRGASGGYGLAKSLDAVSLFELITTIEGPFQFVKCASRDVEALKNQCGLETSCPIRTPVHKIHDKLRGFLESVTLAELLESDTGPVVTRGSNGQADSLRPACVEEITE